MRRVALIAALGLLAACSTLRGPRPEPQRFVIFFSEFSANLDESAEGSVRAAADWANQHPKVPVVVAGYASPSGSVAANEELSKLRAQVVADGLIRDGVATARIQKVARGPVAFALGAQESRRVEIQIAR